MRSVFAGAFKRVVINERGGQMGAREVPQRWCGVHAFSPCATSMPAPACARRVVRADGVYVHPQPSERCKGARMHALSQLCHSSVTALSQLCHSRPHSCCPEPNESVTVAMSQQPTTHAAACAVCNTLPNRVCGKRPQPRVGAMLSAHLPVLAAPLIAV